MTQTNITRITSINRFKAVSFAILVALPVWAGEVGTHAVPSPAPNAKDSAMTREQGDAILNELRQVRQLLERNMRPPAPSAPSAPQPAARAKLKIDGTNILGSPDAPFTMVEYSDTQCPFCKKFQDTAFEEIRKNYIDTGKLRLVMRDLPLDFHPNAMRAAVAARCAGEEGQFWKMRDTLVANNTKLSEEDIAGYAKDLHLDAPKFHACLASNKYKAQIDKEGAEAAALNISGTPSFVIGRTTPEGVDGVTLVGAQPYAAFEARLKALDAPR